MASTEVRLKRFSEFQSVIMINYDLYLRTNRIAAYTDLAGCSSAGSVPPY